MNRLTVFIIEGHSKSRVEEFLRQIDEVRRKEEEEYKGLRQKVWKEIGEWIRERKAVCH